jgi:hypothetical protein
LPGRLVSSPSIIGAAAAGSTSPGRPIAWIVVAVAVEASSGTSGSRTSVSVPSRWGLCPASILTFPAPPCLLLPPFLVLALVLLEGLPSSLLALLPGRLGSPLLLRRGSRRGPLHLRKLRMVVPHLDQRQRKPWNPGWGTSCFHGRGNLPRCLECSSRAAFGSWAD